MAALYVKVVVRSTYWDHNDSFASLKFSPTGAGTYGDDLIEAANWLSGPFGPTYHGPTGQEGLVGPDGGPSELEFVFLAPDGMLTMPCDAQMLFSSAYDAHEVDVLTSPDGVTYTLSATVEVPLSVSFDPIDFAMSGSAVFVPWWTDHNNTQETA